MTTTARGERAAASDDIVLRVERLGKTYGGVVALRDVTLEIRRGSIHGLLGENGAGKSTLVGLISGQRVPSSGSIYMNGVAVEKADVPTMEEAGLFLVTQEPMIVDHVSAAENLLLGIWPQRRGFVNWRRLRSEAARMLEGTGIDPGAMAGRLDAVSRRKLNILRAMFSGGRVIILDEPTAALTVEDRGRLFEFMRRLKADGVTFIFISHHNDEILDICDAVSVLRDGRLAGGSENVADLTSEALHELVLGRGLELFQRVRRSFPPDAPVIELADVVARQVDVPTLRLRPGEIVGCTGLPGAGAKELARTMFGLNRARSGTLRFPGAEPIALPRTPRDAFRAGIAFLSDDRRREGAVGKMSIGDNIALSSLSEVARVGFVSRDAEERLARRFFEAFGIKAASPDVPVDALSGGNQQKVCLSRVLATNPRLLILDEPTRGIDVGVKQDVLRIIDDLSKTGVPIMIVSTDTDEIMRIADRVLLFRGGSIVDELAGDEINNDRLRRLSHA